MGLYGQTNIYRSVPRMVQRDNLSWGTFLSIFILLLMWLFIYISGFFEKKNRMLIDNIKQELGVK